MQTSARLIENAPAGMAPSVGELDLEPVRSAREILVETAQVQGDLSIDRKVAAEELLDETLFRLGASKYRFGVPGLYHASRNKLHAGLRHGGEMGLNEAGRRLNVVVHEQRELSPRHTQAKIHRCGNAGGLQTSEPNAALAHKTLQSIGDNGFV